MATGTRTANVMDIPLSMSSVTVPYLGDGGYKFLDIDTVRILSSDNGTTANYNESQAVTPFGTPNLIVPVEQVLTLSYNKSMIGRVQKTQLQDIPIDGFAKKWAIQQADEVFVPEFDKYVIGKVLAARETTNKVVLANLNDARTIRQKFATMVNKAKRHASGQTAQLIVWVGYEFGAALSDAINFTGSEMGYKEGQNGYLGKHRGAKIVEAPDDYFTSTTHAICADKRAIVLVKPKMDPKGDGVVILDKVPGFSGSEIQIRHRSDCFVLNRKKKAISSLETA